VYVFNYIITGVNFLNNKKYIKIKKSGEGQTGEFQEWGGSVTDKLSLVCQPLKTNVRFLHRKRQEEEDNYEEYP